MLRVEDEELNTALSTSFFPFFLIDARNCDHCRAFRRGIRRTRRFAEDEISRDSRRSLASSSFFITSPRNTVARNNRGNNSATARRVPRGSQLSNFILDSMEKKYLVIIKI